MTRAPSAPRPKSRRQRTRTIERRVPAQVGATVPIWNASTAEGVIGAPASPAGARHTRYARPRRPRCRGGSRSSPTCDGPGRLRARPVGAARGRSRRELQGQRLDAVLDAAREHVHIGVVEVDRGTLGGEVQRCDRIGGISSRAPESSSMGAVSRTPRACGARTSRTNLRSRT